MRSANPLTLDCDLVYVSEEMGLVWLTDASAGLCGDEWLAVSTLLCGRHKRAFKSSASGFLLRGNAMARRDVNTER